MNFAVTEMGTFERCKRQATLTSRNGSHLTPITTPVHLSVGTITHRAHQLWLNDPDNPLSIHTLNACSEAQDAAVKNYKKVVGTTPTDQELSPMYEAIEMVVAMAENYAIKYSSPLPPDYNLLAAEQHIVVPIPETRHKCPDCNGIGMLPDKELRAYTNKCPTCNGTGEEVHCLEGRLDGLIQHVSGRVAVLERKTYKNRPKANDLKSNEQFLSYIFLVHSLNVFPGIPVLAYDGMWRRASVPKGRTFDDLFSRYFLERTQAELDEFARFLPYRLNDMAATYRDPLHLARPHRRWQGCWDCGVEEICSAMSRGLSPTGIISSKFTERTDDTTEDDAEQEE